MRLQPDSLLAAGEAPSPTQPVWAYVCIGWMAAATAPWLLRAGHRFLILGCSNKSADKKKLANPSFAAVWLHVIAMLGSMVFAVVAWVEWNWSFAWAE